MGILPLQLPPLINVPQLDFSPLADLGKQQQERQQEREAVEILNRVYGSGGALPQQQGTLAALGSRIAGLFGGAPSAPVASTASPASGGDYYAKTAQVESGNNPNAQNPNSTAGGIFQFTNGTWLENFDKTFPQFSGLAPGVKLAAKKDPEVQKEVMKTFTADNEAALTNAGIPINDMSRYAAHFFGAGDAQKVLTSPDNVPLANVVSPASIQANSFLRGMTVGDARNWLNKKMAGEKQLPSGPGEGLTKLPGQEVPGMPERLRAAMPALLANPKTRAQAIALGQKYMNPEAELMYRDSQGNLYTRNSATGATKLIDKSQLLTPEELTQKERVAKAGATNVNVNAAAGEKAQEVEVQKEYGKTFIELQKQGRDASASVNSLKAMDRLLDDPNLYTGTGGQAATSIKRALVSIGVADAGTAAPNELFQKLSNKVVLDSTGGSLGSQISNADRDYIANANANISNTPEGNRQIIQMALKVEERKKQVAQLAREYRKTHGNQLDPGFDDHLAEWVEKNPLFPQAPKVTKPVQQRGAVAAPPAAIEHLRANPNLRDAFDQKYGPGAAARALGQ